MDLAGMVINGYSAFPKSEASPLDFLVSYPGNLWGSLTPVQRWTWCILQPQNAVSMVLLFSEFRKYDIGLKLHSPGFALCFSLRGMFWYICIWMTASMYIAMSKPPISRIPVYFIFFSFFFFFLRLGEVGWQGPLEDSN